MNFDFRFAPLNVYDDVYTVIVISPVHPVHSSIHILIIIIIIIGTQDDDDDDD